MATRIWQIPSGVITTLLIAFCLRPEQQGIYFLILSITGLQALADAGLLNTIMHAASHEIAGMRVDSGGVIRGPKSNRSRLAAITRFAVTWFAIAAAILIIGGVIFGYLMLLRKQMVSMAFMPLAFAVLASGLTLSIAPLVALLEGCNQVQVVNRYRLGQVITGSLAVWAFLALNAHVWAIAASVLVQLVWELSLVLGRYRKLFVQLWRTKPGQFQWRTEIWPLQWRIGVQSVVRYLALMPMVPVLFDVHGPEIAGRYGMTWQIFSNLLMVSYVYARTKSPDFGRLIAERKRHESFVLLKRVTLGSTFVLTILVVAFCATLFVMNGLGFWFAVLISSRFLTPWTCVLFAFAMVPMHLAQCFSLYIRSQRFDPIWRVSIPASICLGLAGYSASYFGRPDWIALAMLGTFSVTSAVLSVMTLHYHKHFETQA